MLRHLELTNFKCYERASFDFRGLTVLSGMNTAGKSTVLQALGFMRQNTMSDRAPDVVSLDGPLAAFKSVDDLVNDNARDGAYSEVGIAATGDGDAFNCEMHVQASRAENQRPATTIPVATMSPAAQVPFMGKFFVHVGADRIAPQSFYRIPANMDELAVSMLGERCEYTAWYLNRADYNTHSARARLYPLSEGDDRPAISQQVSQDISRLGRNVRVVPRAHPDISLASFRFSFLEGRTYGNEHRPENVGYGLTSALPIYTALLDMEVGGVAFVENPELHLHPMAQVEIGRFLARVASAGVQVFVETHSDHVLNGIRLAVKEGLLSAQDTQLVFIVNGGLENGVGIATPVLRPDGSIDEWPDGFFDQYEKSLGDLLLGNME